MKKNNFITILIIILVIILAIILLSLKGNGNHNGNFQDIATCIGDNSELYIQLGCHACEKQLDLFGDYSSNLTIIDCFYERERCDAITATPTWKINNEYYKGVRTIEELQNLTNCIFEDIPTGTNIE